MIVAELRVVPIGSGSSMEQTVERVVEALKAQGIAHKVGPLATTIEAESLESVLKALSVAHKAAAETAPRILTELTLDERFDKEETAKSLTAVEAEPTGEPS